jgi:hypothetical protein
MCYESPDLGGPLHTPPLRQPVGMDEPLANYLATVQADPHPGR